MNVPRRLLYVILFFMILVAASSLFQYFNIRVELPRFEELTPPRGGFYKGFTGGGVLFFATYEHPNYGEVALREYAELHSNKFRIYAFSFSTRDVELEVVSYLVRTENRTVREGNVTRTETVEVPYDQRTIKVPIHTIANSFTKTDVELPTSLKERRVDIRLDGHTIFTFKHETWKAYIPAPRYTLGTLFLDRLAYMAGTTLVCLLAFAFAKATINRIKYVPEMPRWVLAVLPSILMFLAGFGAFFIIYYYALLEAAYTFIPIFIVSFIFALYVMRPKPTTWFLGKVVNTEQPTKRLEMIEVIQDENKWWTMMGWRDFIRGRRYEVVLKGNEKDPVWWFQVENSNDRYIVIDDWEEIGDKVVIKVAPIHEKDIEAWQSGLKETKALSHALHEAKQKYYSLLATSKKEAIEEGAAMAELFIEKISEGLGLKEPGKKEEKEKKEEGKSEQKEAGG